MRKQKVVIFGAGTTGRNVYDLIKDDDEKEVLFFIDNSEAKWGGKYLGLRVNSPEALKDHDAYDQVIIGTFSTEIILNQLEGLGVPRAKCDPSYAESLLKAKNRHNWSVMKFVRKILGWLGYKVISKEKQSERDEWYSLLSGIQTYWGIYKQDEYEARWREIGSKYDFVKIFEVGGAGSIGESIQRYFAIRRGEDEEPNVLKVFLALPPSNWAIPRVCNMALFRLFNQHIYMPQEEDVLFWCYVYRRHFHDLDRSDLKKYIARNEFPAYEVELYHHDFTFTDEEVQSAESQMREMGLGKDFVCVGARTPNYNIKTRGGDGNNRDGKNGYDYRSMDFDAYADAINYLGEHHFQTVRMGRGENALEHPLNNCIDYAGQCANEFMDLYLAAHCKFMMVNGSGLGMIPSLFGRPELVVNVVAVSFSNGGTPYTGKDLYIPKKYFDVHKKRYLTLMEMAQTEQECFIYGSKYEETGIRFEENTAEEIQEAAAELLGRLDGTWQDTDEDIENYERYKQIYAKIAELTESNLHPMWGGPAPWRLSASYLRKNKYLLG